MQPISTTRQHEVEHRNEAAINAARLEEQLWSPAEVRQLGSSSLVFMVVDLQPLVMCRVRQVCPLTGKSNRPFALIPPLFPEVFLPFI